MNEINDLKLYFEQNFGKFSELENIRKKYLPQKRLLTIICIFFGFILAGTLFASVSKGKDMIFNILCSFISSVFLSFFLYAILLNVWCFIISYKVTKYLVSNLIHNIIGIINPRMKYALRSPFSLKDIKNSGLFDYYFRLFHSRPQLSTSDYIETAYEDVIFRFANARIITRNAYGNTSSRHHHITHSVIFNGILLTAEFSNLHKSAVYVMPNILSNFTFGNEPNFLIKKLSSLNAPKNTKKLDYQFGGIMKNFEVYCGNHEDAQFLINDRFAKILGKIFKQCPKMKVSFNDSRMYMFLPDINVINWDYQKAFNDFDSVFQAFSNLIFISNTIDELEKYFSNIMHKNI